MVPQADVPGGCVPFTQTFISGVLTTTTTGCGTPIATTIMTSMSSDVAASPIATITSSIASRPGLKNDFDVTRAGSDGLLTVVHYDVVAPSWTVIYVQDSVAHTQTLAPASSGDPTTYIVGMVPGSSAASPTPAAPLANNAHSSSSVGTAQNTADASDAQRSIARQSAHQQSTVTAMSADSGNSAQAKTQAATVTTGTPIYKKVNGVTYGFLEGETMKDMAVCPSADTYLYDSSNGCDVFQIICDTNYNNDYDFQRFGTSDFATCMDLCSQTMDASNNCNAVDWAPPANNGNTGICTLKSVIGTPQNAPGVFGAKRVFSCNGKPIQREDTDGTIVTSDNSYNGSMDGQDSIIRPQVTQNETPAAATSSPANDPRASSAPAAASLSGLSKPATTSSPMTIRNAISLPPLVSSKPSVIVSNPSSYAPAPPGPTILPTNEHPENDGSDAWVTCGILNHKSNTFWLRTHVLFPANGDHNSGRFENLYIQNTIYGAPASYPVLSTSRTSRGQFYYDPSSLSVALWHGQCYFSGLFIDQDTNMDEWSPVFIQDAVGSPRMSIADGQLTWLNDRWGSWLACEDGKRGETTLRYWDTITGAGIDVEKCAKVQIIVEIV